MKIFLAGDFYSGTGPANVTQNLIRTFPDQVTYQHYKSKLLRIPEIIIKTLTCHAVVYSGYSLQNILGIYVAKIFHKPSFYIHHGSIWYENQLNKVENAFMAAQERKILEHADYILAVSNPFKDWMKKQYPEFNDKIYALTNGIDWDTLEKHSASHRQKNNWILSVGGGTPCKNILSVCHAINLIYTEYPSCDIQLVVLGSPGYDSAQINQFPFVKNMGVLEYKKTLNLMRQSKLFIQNSRFETFGLASIEALISGCSLLLSKNVGALSIIEQAQSCDIIEDTDNIVELKNKIIYSLNHSNQERLLSSIDRKKTSCEARGRELYHIIKALGGIQ